MSIKEEIPQGSYAYSMDLRNLQHSKLQWRFCTKHYCTFFLFLFLFDSYTGSSFTAMQIF